MTSHTVGSISRTILVNYRNVPGMYHKEYVITEIPQLYHKLHEKGIDIKHLPQSLCKYFGSTIIWLNNCS